MPDQFIRVWDGPLRVFHWLLAVSVLAAITTGWLGGNWMLWHGRLGVMVLGLLVFRLLWGFWGSTYARWGCIFRAPLSIPAYLSGNWHQAGHNPLGALSVLALLGLTGLQVFTGLFANDDIAFQGPLYTLVTRSLSGELTDLHRQIQWLLVGLVGLHLSALVFYRCRGLALVPPMITGRMPQHAPEQQSAQGGSLRVALVAVLLAGVVVWGVQELGGWLAPPVSAVNSSAPSTPDW